jgi:hypothetical protein
MQNLILLVTVFVFACATSPKPAPMLDQSDSPPTNETAPKDETPQATQPTPPKTNPNQEIDLGFEGEYGELEVESSDKPKGKRHDHSNLPGADKYDWSCTRASECEERGLPRYKKPGRWLCESDRCVMEYKEYGPGDIEEL